MAVKKTYYRKKRRTYGSRSLSLGKVIAAVLAAAILITSGIILIPRLVHHCDSCDKLFLGTGYYANAVTNVLASLSGNDDKILCRSCAESNHALEILAGKSLEDFRIPLFE